MEGTPKHPKTFGEEMQRLRTEAGLTLEDIAAETKISKRILLGLENGDFRFLPQKVFCRNFVAQYASVVGADPRPLSDAFEAAWDRFLLASGSHPSLVLDDPPLVRRVRWRFWAPVAASAAILIAAAFVIWRSSGDGGQYAAVRHARPALSDGRAPQPVSGEPRRPTPSPVIAVEPTPLTAEMVSITIRVRPEMECWIHFRDHNGAAGGKLLSGGTEERIELAGPVKLTVGDAGAASLEVLGRTYDDLGRPGQVVHTEVSSEGLVVLGPRPRDG
jgi:DNA-binding XRE family transcriptional regulator